MAGVEVDDGGADGVEEGAVVAGHEDGAGEGDELGLEVFESLVVEVVAGFVEDEAFGASCEEGGEGEAAALPSAELLDGAGAVDGVETESLCGDLGAAIGIPGVVERRPAQESVIGLCRNGIGESVADLLEACDGIVEWCEGLGEDVADGVARVESAVLGKVAKVTKCGDRAMVRLLDAGREADERGLARTYLADETDTLAPGRP